MKWNYNLCVVAKSQESVKIETVVRCDIYVQQDQAKASYT